MDYSCLSKGSGCIEIQNCTSVTSGVCGEASLDFSRLVKSDKDKAVPRKFAKFPRIFRINFQTYEIKYYVPMLVLFVDIITLECPKCCYLTSQNICIILILEYE